MHDAQALSKDRLTRSVRRHLLSWIQQGDQTQQPAGWTEYLRKEDTGLQQLKGLGHYYIINLSVVTFFCHLLLYFGDLFIYGVPDSLTDYPYGYY